MNNLTPMEQLLAFCDWQRKHEPPPAGQKHIAEWAAEEIERLRMVLQDIKDWDIDEALRPDSERGARFALPLRLRALIQTALGATMTVPTAT